MKRILFTVTNDLTYDQRMQRICTALSNAGYECELIGRARNQSIELPNQVFQQTRLKCWFDAGFAFYAEYNIRLFIYLLFHRFDAVCSIDLDTILPGFFTTKLKRKPHVYDAHEYFSQMQEIVSRPLVHKVWLAIERFMMPRIKHGYTIGEGYANIFKKEYDLDFEIIRNVPFAIAEPAPATGEKSILYQGAINVGRGLEEMIEAMTQLDGIKLIIVGEGPELPRLKELAKSVGVEEKVVFKGALLPQDLKKETGKHWLGLTLFSNIGEHHQLSLANRFFDYIQSGVPQIAMNYAEYAHLNQRYNMAYMLNELKSETLVSLIRKIEADPSLYEEKKQNSKTAGNNLCWENESEKLIEIYRELL
jgi:glycosyltransferase involved in cell wall biosynthesis